jgi:hypothetical protein
LKYLNIQTNYIKVCTSVQQILIFPGDFSCYNQNRDSEFKPAFLSKDVLIAGVMGKGEERIIDNYGRLKYQVME